MTKLVDFHVQVFPDPLAKVSSQPLLASLAPLISSERVQDLRRQARSWLRPVTHSLHGAQTLLRYLPESARKGFDELCGLVPLPGLLVESTLEDLTEAMEEADMDYVVVIAHPQVIPNEFVLELGQMNSKFIPAVNIAKSTPKPATTLKEYAKNGARVLKIHPAADGEDSESPRYKKLIKTATELGLPVIIHTGSIHSRVLFRDPSQGHAKSFQNWFQEFPETQFVLAHMNFHEPGIALDLCEDYPNVWVNTSWQPSEIIGEAVRRIGAERVLFSSDWPLVGNNMKISRKRVEDCIEIGLLNQMQAKLILGENAFKLLGLSDYAD